MRKGEKAILVTSVHNGGTYTIGEDLFKANSKDWIEYVYKPDPVVEEEYNGIGDDSLNEISYDDLRLLLKARGVDFKGNASKKTLLDLLDNSEE